LERLSLHFDWILIDTPPVAPLTDAVSLSRHVDGTLLVVRAGCTPQEAVKEALTLIGPKHVLGIVFNAAESLNRLYSQYYGYYDKK
jgi:Mrp family chromosome partitioning ATPase